MSNATRKGPWQEPEIAEFLETSGVPMRLAAVGGDGFPRVVSVWYRYRAPTLQCVTHRDSQLARLLGQNARVGFEIAPNEPPYHGLRGQALASISAEGAEPALRDMLQRYLGGTGSGLGQWLLSRAEEELLVTLEPQRLFSWDYRERMADVS